jgi:hypothetical protein
MTSVTSATKTIPADSRNFVVISSLLYSGSINSLNTTNGTLSTAQWAGSVVTGQPTNTTRYTSSINTPGTRLRDMGRTYVSATRVFRKIQLIVPMSSNQSTFGVEGQSGTTPLIDFLTGYVEIGWEGAGSNPAPIARTF